MQSQKFHIPVKPVAKARARVTRSGFTYTPLKTKRCELDIRYYLMEQGASQWTGPLRLGVVFNFLRPKSLTKKKALERPHPTVKPDIDNLLKTIMDAGNEVLWKDDSQVVELHARKAYGDTECIELVVTAI
jgi:Holliday junction resolvase RusA-like endonuclease